MDIFRQIQKLLVTDDPCAVLADFYFDQYGNFLFLPAEDSFQLIDLNPVIDPQTDVNAPVQGFYPLEFTVSHNLVGYEYVLQPLGGHDFSLAGLCNGYPGSTELDLQFCSVRHLVRRGTGPQANFETLRLLLHETQFIRHDVLLTT